jgi:hypothetical protein
VALGSLHATAIDADVVGRLRLDAHLDDRLAVDGDASGGDQLFRRAP